jgi:hemerythrin superfamily protein
MAYRDEWVSGRNLAAFGVGALLMLVMSRVMPPVAGRAIGSMRAMAGGDPFDALTQDHRKVLALFDVVEGTDNSATARRAALLLQIKRMLTAHALAEEDIVYPMLRNDAQRQEAASHLYREHAEMKVRLFELEHMAKDDPRWITELRSLRDIIAHHAREEEETEFPRLRAALGDRTGQLLSDVQREKAMVL